MKPEIKLFEVRDRATMFTAMAVRIEIEMSDRSRETRLLRRAGYGPDFPYVLLIDTVSNQTEYDPFNWNSITLQPVHEELIRNWSDYETGDLIDAEYLRGERDAPRETELA